MTTTLTKTDRWPLIRFVASVYPRVNIFTKSRVPPLGLINVATAANMVWGWRVEVIDENNYRGPRDKNGLPDHARLQAENPAAIVCFYCGLTSTMDRVFELSEFYHGQGAFIIGGGWHAHFCPDEVLSHGFDVVAHGEGELVIRDIILAWREKNDLAGIPGISFLNGGAVKTNPPASLELPDLSDLPYPDFGLLRYARPIKTYPISRVRGCRMKCEFCSVKGAPRWASPEHIFGTIRWLVETRGAKRFFFVDDRLEENPAGLLEVLRLIREKYGDRLRFTAQIRLETAKETELITAMSQAGVRTVCVGYESPDARDLKTMHKGLPAQKMIEWTLILRRLFMVHGMFIWGYPSKEPASISVPEAIKGYKSFIRRARITSIQVLHPVPLVGTELRARLEEQGRVFPLKLVPWNMYDGSFACFVPKNMTLKELQNAPIQIMDWFYSRWSFWRIPFRTLAFPIHYLFSGWRNWHDSWLREIIRYGGHRLVLRWQRDNGDVSFVKRLEGWAATRPKS